MPSLDYQGVAANGNSSFPYTGGFQSEAVGDYTVDINCDQPCPVFPESAFLVNFSAPDFFEITPEDEFGQTTVGFGPYQQVEWNRGVSLTQEAYEGYVPVGSHFEFQKPYIQNVSWVWRGEATVLTAMVQTGEVDIAFDVGVDAIDVLEPEQVKAGSSAEVFTFWINTLWHPELKKTEVRQALAAGAERQELMAELADRAHDHVLFLPLFETPVIYALDPQLNFEPRFDRRIRVNSMWFSP